ncbi:uncharacterized protein LOC108466355 [Gossypium arboreum]|uniref:uncharacterized protein LOC108466355 n=1 Tax=Gossypium arboreum TaxID=29729 RepID=UPI0008196D4A|nr:uncharacterized protein LOC108466355 [Gossypium arboreum]
MPVSRFRQVENGETSDFGLNGEGVLCFRGRVCIPNDSGLKQSILREAHGSPYVIHPGGISYTEIFVKAERQLPSRLLQQVKIPLWMWKRVTMDFKLAKLYMAEIVRLHGVPASIISNRDPRCCTPTCWTKLGERRILGPKLIADTEDKVKLIRDRLKEGFDRQKSYADLKRPIAYQLELPLELERIHDVFHISMLRRYRSDPSHVVPVEEIEVRPDLTIKEEPVQILECDVKVLRKKSVPLVKVLWRNHRVEKAMWELEEAMQHQYPHLF